MSVLDDPELKKKTIVTADEAAILVESVDSGFPYESAEYDREGRRLDVCIMLQLAALNEEIENCAPIHSKFVGFHQ